jgi:hypothetical protein
VDTPFGFPSLAQGDKSNRERSPSLVVAIVGDLCFRFPAARPAFQYVSVMEDSVEPRGDCGSIAEHFPQSSTGLFEVNTVLVRS